MLKTNHIPQLALSAFVFLSAIGCTHVQKPEIQAYQFSPDAMGKIPLKVALVTEPSLNDYTFSFSKMGDTWKYPLGEHLATYAREVSRHSFASVEEVSDASSASAGFDVILQPRVAKMDHAAGMLAWQDRTLILLVEWTMRDAATKNTVWLATIEARAAHNAGNMFTGSSNERKLFQKLFDNLTTNTVHAFTEAPEIRGLATRKNARVQASR